MAPSQSICADLSIRSTVLAGRGQAGEPRGRNELLPSGKMDRLGDRDFGRLAKLLEDVTGIRLPPNKRMMIEGRLRKRVHALALPDLRSYVAYLFEYGGLDAELVELIDCVTTNKTDFFREREHFALLEREIVPRILAEWPKGTPKRLKFWSAASSTGAEAYTLAMVLRSLAPVLEFQFEILGTDISTNVLQQARRAVYPEEMIEPVPVAFRDKYLMRARNPARREIRIVPELRRLVRFERLNLMDPRYPFPRSFDAIMCRNVLIYFDKATQAKVLARLCDHLKPGGYLFLGHSESMAGGQQPNIQQVFPTVYRRM